MTDEHERDPYPDGFRGNGEDKAARNNAAGEAKPNRARFILDNHGSADAPKMLVKGLVPIDGICFLGGQSGAGKTFIEIHLAACLVSEIAFSAIRSRNASAARSWLPKASAVSSGASTRPGLPLASRTRFRLRGGL